MPRLWSAIRRATRDARRGLDHLDFSVDRARSALPGRCCSRQSSSPLIAHGEVSPLARVIDRDGVAVPRSTASQCTRPGYEGGSQLTRRSYRFVRRAALGVAVFFPRAVSALDRGQSPGMARKISWPAVAGFLLKRVGTIQDRIPSIACFLRSARCLDRSARSRHAVVTVAPRGLAWGASAVVWGSIALARPARRPDDHLAVRVAPSRTPAWRWTRGSSAFSQSADRRPSRRLRLAAVGQPRLPEPFFGESAAGFITCLYNSLRSLRTDRRETIGDPFVPLFPCRWDSDERFALPSFRSGCLLILSAVPPSRLGLQ
jgi:hypothetical protein